MPDTNFDIAFWLLWRQVLHWFVIAVGLISAFVAFGRFKGDSDSSMNMAAFCLALAIVVLMGCLPIEWGLETDRANYAYVFLTIQNTGIDLNGHDNEIGFWAINYLLGKILNVQQYFIAIALIYVGNYWIALKRLAGANIYWLLVAVVLSMGFVGYNTNTMRAGLALSFVMLGLSMYPSKVKMILLMVIAASIHGSAMIPIAMVLVSSLYDNTRLYYKLWLLAVPVSFFAGGFFNSLFAGVGDDARSSYLTSANDGYNIGFRLDFILYSLAPMAVGAYYIFRRGFSDKFYRLLYNSYLLTNIFWILVIRANYSDRFAYLSWFMIPVVLMYPLLRESKVVQNPNKWIATILLGETIFSIVI